MAMTNHDRVGKGMELLRDGLRPYIERQYQARYGENWITEAAQLLRRERAWTGEDGQPHLDVQALLGLMWFSWQEIFRTTLGHTERSMVSELREARNRWAHQETFSTDDADRTLDSITRLLRSIVAPQARARPRSCDKICCASVSRSRRGMRRGRSRLRPLRAGRPRD